MTIEALADWLRIAPRWAREYMKIWHTDQKVYIRKWVRNLGVGGGFTPVYALKTKPNQSDRPKPTPLTPAQRSARWRALNRQEVNAKKRAKRRGDTSPATIPLSLL